MAETIAKNRNGAVDNHLVITRGVMSLFDSWGLHSEEMMSLLDINGKPRHMIQYRHNKPLPINASTIKRIEYLVQDQSGSTSS
ncbi:MAG: hypothetical protein P8Z39_01790 [Gammaproteobacteria bacterium]